MKITNEEKVMSILEYIKDYQVKEGRSPSYRQLAKAFNFQSIATSQRYIGLLQSRGLIQKSDNGQILVPHNLDKGQTITAPLVGNIACGDPIYAEQNIEETYQLPTAIFGCKQLYSLIAKGNSMTGVGIYDGDHVFYLPCDTAENGDIVVALIDDSATIKRYFKKDRHYVLHPENPDYKDIITKELKIQGVVKHVIHSFR